MKKLPKEILVFRVEERDANYLSAVENVSEIMEDSDGSEVGVYILNQTYKFRIKRELK